MIHPFWWFLCQSFGEELQKKKKKNCEVSKMNDLFHFRRLFFKKKLKESQWLLERCKQWNILRKFFNSQILLRWASEHKYFPLFLFSSQSPDMFTSDGFIFHNDYSLNRFECKTQYLSLRLCLVQLKEELSHGNIISQIMNGNHLKSIKMNISYTQIKWNKIIDLYWCNCFSYHERYSSGFLLSRLIRGVTENFNTFERAKEVENFFSTVSINYYLNIQQFCPIINGILSLFLSHESTNNHHSFQRMQPGAELTIKQAIENIVSNAKWLQRDRQQIKEFLQNDATSRNS